jgi:hypothetical protein
MVNAYNPEELLDLTNEDLQTYRANARHTEAVCGGHDKARWNGIYVRNYDAEAERRGLEIDKSIEGKFNGAGSY